MRRLFSGMMGAAPEQVVAANNSSLALMHDTILYALLKGTCDSTMPWLRQGPGQGRFPFSARFRAMTGISKFARITGIRLIPVPIYDDGPDIGPGRAASGAGCVDQGHVVRSQVQQSHRQCVFRCGRGASGGDETAAPDFRLYWDNAYAVHHLTEETVEIANVLQLCARHGHPNRALVFASTSKITLPGAGLALFAGSNDNVKWLLARLIPERLGRIRPTISGMFVFSRSRRGSRG